MLNMRKISFEIIYIEFEFFIANMHSVAVMTKQKLESKKLLYSVGS